MTNKSFIFIIFIALLATSCYTRKLKDGQYLLDKNKIEVNNEAINTDELTRILKQRPNKKIFSAMKFHLFLHNLYDSTKVANKKIRKLAKKNRRIRKKNIQRIAKGKDTIPYRTHANYETFGEKVLYSIGEPPVIVDTNIVTKTTKQIHLYLVRKGYFNNMVSDSVKYIDRKNLGLKKKRAIVYYKISAGKPYKINSLDIVSKDSELLTKIQNITSPSLLKTGDIFDIDNLDKERIRITNYLQNDGYFKFSKRFIKFVIDSSLGNKQVDIKTDIELYKTQYLKQDSIIESTHKQFYISKIKIVYIQNETANETTEYTHKGIDFLIKGEDDTRASLFYKALYLYPGDIYNKEKQQLIFRRLTSFGIFKTVNISTEIINDSTDNQLLMTIRTKGVLRQETRYEGNGTLSGGNLGLEGSVSYNQKNSFRGAEIFHFSVATKIESQPTILGNDNSTADIQSYTNFSGWFNTIEFGPEASFTFPTLLFIPSRDHQKLYNPKTIISLSANYQRRLNNNSLSYERGIQEGTFGYAWNVKKKYHHQFDPFSLSAIEINKSPEFQEIINRLNDKYTAARFQNHIISATKYRFIFNDQYSRKKTGFSFYYDGSVESAGNILRGYYALTDKNAAQKTDNYKLLKIEFSQYLKTSHDFRVYNKINSKSSFASRFQVGIGVPLDNSDGALPFEKSFFSGGTDKLRAWKARSLGPGSFRDSVLNYDKTGEILLEGNLEYRFDMLGFLDGAFFVDAGNIWLMNPDSLRPGSDFDFTRFADEIAIGVGFGLRVDLNFFLIRMDLAFPLKNPSLIKGERWFYQPKVEYNTYKSNLSHPEKAPRLYAPQINIGIGYPF